MYRLYIFNIGYDFNWLIKLISIYANQFNQSMHNHDDVCIDLKLNIDKLYTIIFTKLIMFVYTNVYICKFNKVEFKELQMH